MKAASFAFRNIKLRQANAPLQLKWLFSTMFFSCDGFMYFQFTSTHELAVLKCVCMLAAYCHVCIRAHPRLYVCSHHVFTDRPEDHRGRPDPVCEEAVGCNDSDRLLS